MSMLGSLLGGMVDTEKITFDTIQGALEDVAEELGCSHKELFIKISVRIRLRNVTPAYPQGL